MPRLLATLSGLPAARLAPAALPFMLPRLVTEPPHGPGSVTEIFANIVFDSALEIRALRCWIDESSLHVLG